ncbi:MAG: hypothetical protein IBJ11_04725 [Phycisphaerales bacterium]|nr:hypothetical protein [Phycisphaerales bacterium]
MATLSPTSAVSCPRCGYQLLGLAEAATCPECGLPHAALRRLALHLPENGRALRLLRIGLGMAIVRLVLGPLVMHPLVMIVVAFTLANSASGRWFITSLVSFPAVLIGVAQAGHLITSLANPVGIAPDPSSRLLHRLALAVNVVLFAVIAVYLTLAIGFVFWSGSMRFFFIGVGLFVLLTPVSVVATALWHAGAAKMLLHPVPPHSSLIIAAILSGLSYAMAGLLLLGSQDRVHVFCSINGPFVALALGDWLAAYVAWRVDRSLRRPPTDLAAYPPVRPTAR